MHRVLCFGGREYADAAHVDACLTQLWDLFGAQYLIINGGARGADTLCKEWGLRKAWPVITMDAPWQTGGRGAGFLRNSWMIRYAFPTYAVGFPGGPGTRDMTHRLKQAGVALWEV
jgi:hypothetical protein